MTTGVPVSISTGMLRLADAGTNPVVNGVILVGAAHASAKSFTIDVIAPSNCGWTVAGGMSFTVQCAAGQSTATFSFTLDPTSTPADRTIPWAMLVIVRRDGGPANSPVVSTILRIEP